jgi:hypothetical protein
VVTSQCFTDLRETPSGDQIASQPERGSQFAGGTSVKPLGTDITPPGDKGFILPLSSVSAPALTSRRETFSRQGRCVSPPRLFFTLEKHIMTATAQQPQSTTPAQSPRSDYFNLNIKGLGYLSNIRQVNAQTGTFISCVINALSGATDNPSYVRFDVTVAGKEASSLINRCQKAVDEDKKVLLGFMLSHPSTDIFTLNKGEHAGEQRVSLKARLIKVDWVKIGQEMVFKAEKSDSLPPQNGAAQPSYAENSF